MRFITIILALLTIPMFGCKTPPRPGPKPAEANQLAPESLPVRTNSLPHLFLVGDSTVYNVAPGLVGWGNLIGRQFDPTKIVVENHGRPGRSTRTYISQGWWRQVFAVARPGDFVIIQLGHNDSSPINDTNRSRGTLPGIGNESTNLVNGLTHRRETVHTYGWYLRQYIADANAKGMTPILCTSVSRLPQPGKELDTTRSAAWARQVAAQQGVPLIDLNQRALDRWSGKSGEEIRTSYFAGKDTTHFNVTGAELNSACVVEGIRALTNCPLKEFLLAHP
jgi:lysophospholipase L1-like esterase